MFRRSLGAAGRLEGVWGLHGAAWCCKGDAWGCAVGSGGAGEEVREGDSATGMPVDTPVCFLEMWHEGSSSVLQDGGPTWKHQRLD